MRLDEQACRARIGGSGHGVLSTVHPVRGVDAVPVVFVVAGERIVIPIDTVKAKSGTRLQRLANLDQDDRCVLLIDHYDDDWSQLWWVRAHGRAVEAAATPGMLDGLGDAFPAYRAADAVTSVIVLTIDALHRLDGVGTFRRYRAAMRLGVFGINSGSTYRPADTLATVRLAEELGFDSVWAGEHVVVPSPRVVPSPMEPEDPILDPLVHLGFVAAASERLLLATGIIILPQRNPLVLAKQAATLDVLSGGRLLLGIGAGYLEPEMTAIGVPMADRGTRTDDHLAAMRALWTQPGPVEHHGPYVDFSGVDAHPRPVTPGGPRILVGGHTPAAYRRAVAHGHGWYGFGLPPELAAACVEGLRQARGQVDRPAELGELELSVTPRRRLDAEALSAFTAAGFHRLVVNTASDRSPGDVEQRLRAAAELVA